MAPPSVQGPIPAELEARRSRLEREYADLQSDLGGLVYEMAIRDSYRLDVVTRQAAKLQAIDVQLSEVERAIAALAQPPAPAIAPAAPPPAAPGACAACGRPIQTGAGFCGSCGAPVSSQ